MQKAFVKKNPPWVNYPDISTPIIADELNRVEDGIDTIDDRVVAFDTSKANQNDLLVTFKAVSFNSTTGVFTFTKWNETTVTVDTDIEKIAVNFDYDDDPTSAHYQSLVLTLSDGTIKYVDLSALITEYEFTDSSTIAFTVASSGAVSASVINGSITADKLQPNYLADITTQANNAAASATSAGNSKLDSEAWANGTRNGQPVGSSDPAYHNNSKYWKDQAQQIASGSIGGLSDVTIDTVTLANGQVLVYDSNTQQWENQVNPIIIPHLVIISDTGSTVTASKGTTVISCTETSTGVFECDVPEFGTWVIDALLGGDDAQVSLVVDTVKVYTVDDSHFHADITVTFPSGGTCSCSKSGETTLYANTSPYTFTVHTSGTWTITVTANGETYTDSVNITTSGQTESLLIPVGSSATPTGSVATLLSCAGINDTSITTLSDLLADSTTLLAVISSNNAIDYLVRSTEFATDITTNSNAMTYIGLNNYASNTLLGNSTWLNAICDSTYFESVLNVKVPTMTGDSTPSGVVSYNSQLNGFLGYYVFDGDVSTYWVTASQSNNGWVQYKFPSAVCIKKLYVYDGYGQGTQHVIKTFDFQGSNNGTTCTTLRTVTRTSGAETDFAIENNQNYLYYRLNIQSTLGGYIALQEIQFYGRQDV